MWIYIWTTEPKSIYVWTTPVKEVYVWTTKVRPSEWKPWANTVAYRPLNSTTTVKDQSWNNYNLTQTGGSFGTYNGVNCFYNGGGTTGYFTLTSGAKIPSGNASRTILMRTNIPETNYNYQRYFIEYWRHQDGDAVFIENHRPSSSSSYFRCSAGFWNSGYATTTDSYLSLNTWYSFAFVYSNTMNLYVNGTLAKSTSPTRTINTTAISSSYPLRIMKWATSTSNNYQVRWYISEVIIENKARTADEILAYYNQTKGNYWL